MNLGVSALTLLRLNTLGYSLEVSRNQSEHVKYRVTLVHVPSNYAVEIFRQLEGASDWYYLDSHAEPVHCLTLEVAIREVITFDSLTF